MRVGSLVFATNQGLGILAKSFYDNGIITDVAIIAHGKHKDNWDWYPSNSLKVFSLRDIKTLSMLEEFCKSMDVMLFFETPFVWELLPFCREHKVKTVIIPMYECMPKQMPYELDLYINPSLLDQDFYPQGIYLPVPIDTVKVPYKRRQKAEVFVHNAGHGGLKGRNGTSKLLDALHYIKSPVRLILRTQKQIPGYGTSMIIHLGEVTLDYRYEATHYDQLFTEGDVFIFPETHNGLSLPLQEAFASGMMVMATNRYPMNLWLPTSPLIEPEGYKTNCISPRFNDFSQTIIDPKRIAAKIDEWDGMDINYFSGMGLAYREMNSWSVWKPKYLEVLKGI